MLLIFGKKQLLVCDKLQYCQAKIEINNYVFNLISIKRHVYKTPYKSVACVIYLDYILEECSPWRRLSLKTGISFRKSGGNLFYVLIFFNHKHMSAWTCDMVANLLQSHILILLWSSLCSEKYSSLGRLLLDVFSVCSICRLMLISWELMKRDAL